MRVVTFNLLTRESVDGDARHRAAVGVLSELDADVVALQEVHWAGASTPVGELLASRYTAVGLPGASPQYGGEVLASRCPVLATHVLDQPVEVGSAPSADFRATAVALEIERPDGSGPCLVVHHRGTFERHLEVVREGQVVATARFVESLVAGRDDLPVVLMGDFNAEPQSASMRFLTGRQSLEGLSVCYDDAWEAVHGSAPGWTFDPANPLVRAGQMPLERGRRIDYVLVRSGAHGPLLDVVGCRLLGQDEVDGRQVSDHYGVLAELAPPPHRPGSWGPGEGDEPGRDRDGIG